MKIQYASDLHLEFPQNKEFLKVNPLKPGGDLLILAGDIVPFAVMDKHNDFFDYISANFRKTWWIPGNHEYYHYDAAKRSGTHAENIRSNVRLVNNLTLMEGNIRFIFTTLWSKISPGYHWEIEKQMSDFHQIKYNGYRLSAEVYNQLHDESLSFLKAELEEKSYGKTVVVTHHAPTFFNYPEKYRGDVLNEAFAVELFDLIDACNADCWIYGHLHHTIPDFFIGKTRLTSNQLGYVEMNEQGAFKPDRSIKI